VNCLGLRVITVVVDYGYFFGSYNTKTCFIVKLLYYCDSVLYCHYHKVFLVSRLLMLTRQ